MANWKETTVGMAKFVLVAFIMGIAYGACKAGTRLVELALP